jgi:hypothetical protein
METYMTVIRNDDHHDKFDVVFVNQGTRLPRYPDRVYRFDAAANQAWSQAQRRNVPLIIKIEP